MSEGGGSEMVASMELGSMDWKVVLGNGLFGI